MIWAMISGAAALAGLGYLGKKSWLALHKVVDINPTTPCMTSKAHLIAKLSKRAKALNLTDTLLQPLDQTTLNQLQRIDYKATQWLSARQMDKGGRATSRLKAQVGPSITKGLDDETAFVLKKRLMVRLPQALAQYQALYLLHGHDDNTHAAGQEQLNQGWQTLHALLQRLETDLDEQLLACGQHQLSQLQINQRYR